MRHPDNNEPCRLSQPERLPHHIPHPLAACSVSPVRPQLRPGSFTTPVPPARRRSFSPDRKAPGPASGLPGRLALEAPWGDPLTGRPVMRFVTRAQSPAALNIRQDSCGAVRLHARTVPRSISMPLSVSHAVLGRMPMESTTRSAGNVPALDFTAVTRLSPSSSSTHHPGDHADSVFLQMTFRIEGHFPDPARPA